MSSPIATAPSEASTAGTKLVASELGPGAGASAAATFCTAYTAITETIKANKSLILIASIAENVFLGVSKDFPGNLESTKENVGSNI